MSRAQPCLSALLHASHSKYLYYTPTPQQYRYYRCHTQPYLCHTQPLSHANNTFCRSPTIPQQYRYHDNGLPQPNNTPTIPLSHNGIVGVLLCHSPTIPQQYRCHTQQRPLANPPHPNKFHPTPHTPHPTPHTPNAKPETRNHDLRVTQTTGCGALQARRLGLEDLSKR